MAVNFFEKYGIKEVANVTFIALSTDRNPKTGEILYEAGDPVLYLNTLKVSTTEQTAENTSANGGWSNPKLITWDFGKEITINLEDAVASFEQLRIMLGGRLNLASASTKVDYTITADQVQPTDGTFTRPVGMPAAKFPFKYMNMNQMTRGQIKDAEELEIWEEDIKALDRIRVWYTIEVDGTNGSAVEFIISSDTFPGTYQIIGDSKMRSMDTGADELIQFIINKGKVMSEVTLAMEAEGDPTVFNMSVDVLRDEDGDMMRWVKYNPI